MKKKVCVVMLVVFSLIATQVMAFASNILSNSTFDDGVGLPWRVIDSYPAESEFSVKDGGYHITVINSGNPQNRWDIMFCYRDINIIEGSIYTVMFTVTANKDCKIYAKVGDMGAPYFEDWNIGNRSWQPKVLKAGETWECVEKFTGTRNADRCELAFHLGGKDVPAGTEFIFDDIYLDVLGMPPPTSSPIPPMKGIRVNQEGYYPELNKKATLLSDSDLPVDWSLKNSEGETVAEDKTEVFGFDKDSGDNVHIIDFSSYKKEGTGYVLEAGGEKSYPFDISEDIYDSLKNDALKYFYHQRSGIPIYAEYAGGIEWARPEAHKPDILGGDKLMGSEWEPYDSDHTLDVTGGWYDLVDHGKYVVGGSFAIWMMQNLYERAEHFDNKSRYEDGKLNIPESGNDYPDILDEARYNLECLMKMQVPAGYPREGMVHHKASDEKWNVLALAPHETVTYRCLKPPTTEATLNLAAVAAQASRIWKNYDPEFASKCIEVAEIAWDAAVANPNIFPPSDLLYENSILQSHIDDEFYWAAAELYSTTGKEKYFDYIESSKWYLKIPSYLGSDEDEESGTRASFDSKITHSLGTITLALVPRDIPKEDIKVAKDNIKKAADDYIELQSAQGYGVPFEQSLVVSSNEDGYVWASNYYMLNNSIVMAYAYDYTKDVRYLNGAAETMDYIMGRNPNFKSYVTGYGENHAMFPHHIFFAHQVDPDYPMAPAGIVVGGPNSGLEDPYVKCMGMLFENIPPQKCYVDHIEAWSVNECSIVWNASLAWIAGYLDENLNSTPTDVIEPTPTPVDVRKGDVNEDGTINSTDYAIVKRYILGALPGTSDLVNIEVTADVNSDGVVNSTDYAWIKKYILGLVDEFPG